MAEVGVLNLTIQSNSEQAAAGLNKLVSAMQRVKNAVGNGLNLGNYANGLAKLGKIVTDNIHGSTIEKLSQLADSLKKLKDAGGSLSQIGKLEKLVNGSSDSGIDKVIDGFTDATDTVSGLKAELQAVKDTGEIKIPVKTVVDDHLKEIFAHPVTGNPIGNTKQALEDYKKYTSLPARTLEDYYTGTRWKRNYETGENYQYTNPKDLMSSWLHGQGSEREQLYALQQVAQQFGLTVDEVKQRIAELNGESSAVAGSMGDIKNETSSMTDQAEKASWSLKDLKERLGELKKTSGKGVFGNLLSSFERLVKYRILRTIIRKITSGFSEGLENVYNYSKAINGSFAPSMDSAASALAQFKNSVGAAAAPLVQALVPYINIAVNALITLANWVNQVFALLKGQTTWTKALTQSANAFDKQKKSASGAAAAIKDLLADWDELNIIQSDSADGGGASQAAEDYLKMFEEVGTFDNRIKKIVDFVKDNLNDILDIAKKVGLAILAWKASTMLTGLLGDLAALAAAGLVIGITWDITTLVDRQYMKTGDPGWLVADALTNLVGATLAGGIVSTVLGGAAGAITAGITLTVSAGISYGIAYANEAGDRAEALKKLSAIKAAVGFAAMSVGFGIASGSAVLGILSGFMVAAPLFTLAAAVAVVVEQWNNATEIAKAAFSGTGEHGIKIDELFKALQDELNKATEGYSLVIDAFSGSTELKTNLAEAFETVTMLSATVKGDGKLTQKEADEFKEAWTTVFEAFEGLTAASFDTIFAGLNKSLTSENAEIREQAKQLRVSTLMIQENLSEALATFRIEQQDLADKIGKGTATAEETEQYFRNLELIAKSSRNSLTDFGAILAGRENIDFGDPEQAVTNAVQFIKDAQDASVKAIEEINTGYQKEMDALETAWTQTQLAHDIGKIDDQQFAMYKEIFDSMRENFNAEAEAEKGKVTSDVQAAYRAVINQALAGIANIPGVMNENGDLDVLQVSAYLAEIMLPIMEAAQDAGAEFSEDFGKMFAIGVNLQDWIGQGWVDKLSEYIKELIKNPEDKPETPALDNSALTQSITDAKGSVNDMCNSIRASIAGLSGLGFSFDTSAGSVTGKMKVSVPRIPMAATGGFIRSGDLIMANENGNIEMMGRMGNSNRSVVANNQQIVEGISHANDGVVNAISTLGDYIVRELQKQNNRPINVNLAPSSAWGDHNARSAEAYAKVTG